MTPTDVAPERPTRRPDAVLVAEDICRRFGAVQALTDARLTVRRGQVTALVGDNGAGKSTLVKIIAGVDRANSGRILLDGKEVRGGDPAEVRRHGLEAVYQDLAVAPDLDIAANLFMGREITRWGFARRLDRVTMRSRATEALERLRVSVPDVDVPVHKLSGGQRQSVAVARAAMWATHIVLMDEPTAALGVSQTDSVLELIRSVADTGVGVLVISHNLQDVFAIADEICVLRLGRTVVQLPAVDLSADDVVALMTGARS
jgi:simple sugar transport system ATP-binding protein